MKTAPTANVPTIDISPLFGSDEETKMNVAMEIQKACLDSGFFLVSNHGVDILPQFVEVTRKFHQSISEEEKMKLAIVAYNKENAKQVRNGYYLPIKGKKAVESFCYLNPNFTPDHPLVKGNTPCVEVNVWPSEEKHPGFRQFQESFYRKLFHMSSVLLKGFALALGKEENFFDEYFKEEDTLSSVRLIRYPYLEHYPPVKTAEDGTKISFDSHEDLSLITVLYQPFVANLQVETENGYQNIPASDDCFLVNCGSYMAHVTNNYFKAPIHRVKWINAERLSLPYFVMLGYHTVIPPFNPHEEEIPSKNGELSYGEYFAKGRVELVVKNGQT